MAPKMRLLRLPRIDAVLSTNSFFSRYWGIGAEGTIPWLDLPGAKDDLRFFQQLSRMYDTCICGRRTWESLPESVRKDPSRSFVILSSTMGREGLGPGGIVLPSADRILEAVADRTALVIGGGQVYDLMMDVVDTLYITSFEEEATTPMPTDTRVYNVLRTPWVNAPSSWSQIAQTPGEHGEMYMTFVQDNHRRVPKDFSLNRNIIAETISKAFHPTRTVRP